MKSRNLIAALIIAGSSAFAQVPQHLNYQGRVSVGGVNFNGTGQFKFALVDGGVNQSQSPQQAYVGTDPETGAITLIYGGFGGSGYTTPPAVTITGSNGSGSGATAEAVLQTGDTGPWGIQQINLLTPGSDYQSPVTVTIAPPPPNIEYQTYWSNAGDLAPGDVPATSVALPVVNGLYSVRLGDNSLPNMAAFSILEIFYTPLNLRVWFSDGTHGFQQLTPDQPLGSAPYALQARLAESVAPGSIGSAQLANGAVSSTKLAVGAAAANLGTSGQSGVASGGMVLSAAENPALTNAGFVKLGKLAVDVSWETRATPPFLAGRYRHTAIWTGSEMIVWGGSNDGPPFGDGGRFNPASNSWTTVSQTGATVRSEHRAVWTGTEMIVWGGAGAGNIVTNTGGRYSPASDTWTATTTAGAPTARGGHAAIWTGSEMIIWGGGVNTGARYNPVSNSWTPISAVGAPAARSGFQSVWTGTEMIIWGGYVTDFNTRLNTGARYNPATDSWSATSLVNAPNAYTIVHSGWTGSELLIYGGSESRSGRYNPTTNTWLPVSGVGMPDQVFFPPVWAGNHWLVINESGGTPLSFHAYDPTTNSWKSLGEDQLLFNYTQGSAVWTGSEVLFWGGITNSAHHNRTVSYTPARGLILYQRP